ncbi:acetyl-coenzyme A synthetase [Striga asiatica]|uniref:Acetyl-coenzyme A synthetase n=1 Tax=Striga asiatica TaxID=4170 RepID=A0A5A7P9A8_STRAF|nr:acetyl-coenzyme A synthetase [Striga asiatica]
MKRGLISAAVQRRQNDECDCGGKVMGWRWRDWRTADGSRQAATGVPRLCRRAVVGGGGRGSAAGGGGGSPQESNQQKESRFVEDQCWESSFLFEILEYHGDMEVAEFVNEVSTDYEGPPIFYDETHEMDEYGAWPHKPGFATLPLFDVQSIIVNEKGYETTYFSENMRSQLFNKFKVPVIRDLNYYGRRVAWSRRIGKMTMAKHGCVREAWSR